MSQRIADQVIKSPLHQSEEFAREGTYFRSTDRSLARVCIHGSIEWLQSTSSDVVGQLVLADAGGLVEMKSSSPSTRCGNLIPAIKVHNSINLRRPFHAPWRSLEGSNASACASPSLGIGAFLKIALSLSCSTASEIAGEPSAFVKRQPPFIWLVVTAAAASSSSFTPATASRTYLLPTSALSVMGEAIRQVNERTSSRSPVDTTPGESSTADVAVVVPALNVSDVIRDAVFNGGNEDAQDAACSTSNRTVVTSVSISVFIPNENVISAVVREWGALVALGTRGRICRALHAAASTWCEGGGSTPAALSGLLWRYRAPPVFHSLGRLFERAVSGAVRRVQRKVAQQHRCECVDDRCSCSSTAKRARSDEDEIKGASHLHEWDADGVADHCLYIVYERVDVLGM